MRWKAGASAEIGGAPSATAHDCDGVCPVSEYADITAVELERRYAAGDIDPVAVWRSVRDRMDAWEPVVHATSHRDDATSDHNALRVFLFCRRNAEI